MPKLIAETARKTGAVVKGPIPLPVKKGDFIIADYGKLGKLELQL